MIAPQSPARATARASASARVAPPADFGNPGAPVEQPPFGSGERGQPPFGSGERGQPPFGSGERGQPPFGDVTNAAPAAPPFADFTGPPPAGPSGPPFGDFTSPPQAGPGGGYAPEQYSELTTDIAGRENPYAPPPNGVAGDFGAPGDFGPASRATVTPPSPDDTTNWPSRDQGRFDQFRPDSDGSAPAKPETPRVRMLPIVIAVVIGAVLLLGVALGIVYLVAGDKSKAISVSTGECVKRDGSAAVKSDCGDASSFQVVSIVDDPAKCEDQKQPYVQNPTDNGKNQYLCLKPQS